MENYTKARTVEQPSVCPFPDLAPDTPEIRVKDGSKIRNLLRFTLSRMEAKPRAAEEAGRPVPEEESVALEGRQEPPSRLLCKQIVFTASGKGVSKAITCAEIVKRRVKGLHQLTRLLHSSVVEEWDPLEPDTGLDSLTVNRKLPAIWILLSVEPLDASELGYQAPGRYDTLWSESSGREEGGGVSGQRTGHKRKGGGGGGGGGRGRGGGGGGGRGRGRGRGGRGPMRQGGRTRDK